MNKKQEALLSTPENSQINDIIKTIEDRVKCGLFADDFTLICSGRNMSVTQDILQWSLKTGFKFSSNKTEFMIFTKNRKLNNPINLHIPKQERHQRSQGTSNCRSNLEQKNVTEKTHM